MIPRFKPDLGLAELRAALSFGDADDVPRFERVFAMEMGQRHAIAFPYGRTGLVLLLEALGLRGTKVICPAYTCVVVAHAIVKSGNQALFIDSMDDGNMDLDRAEAAIGPGVGALIATSLFGHPVDLDRLAQLAERHPHVVIIQDCAHSFAAEWRGRPVQQAGRAAIFGLNISKMATSVFGGMVTTDDDALALALRQVRSRRLLPVRASKGPRRMAYLLAAAIAFHPLVYGTVRWLERTGWLDRFAKYYDEGIIDLPADAFDAMAGLEARVGAVQLAKYRAMVAARTQWATFYRSRLAQHPGLRFPAVPAGASWSHIVAEVANRDEVLRRAEARGVQLGVVIDYCVPLMTAYRGADSQESAWPVAARLARCVINLPVAGVYDPAAAQRVVDVVTACLDEA